MLNALVNGDLFVREKKKKEAQKSEMECRISFFFFITEFMFFYLNANISPRHPV